jgi:23S rRNA (uracil1939-C5)-methyltransferase
VRPAASRRGDQLRAKGAATLETLRRLSGLPLPLPRAILAGAYWGYRVRAQAHTASANGGVEVGYHARGSRRLVVVEHCPVLEPRLERALLDLAGGLPEPAPARIDLAIGDDGRISTAPPTGAGAGGEIERRVGEFVYRLDARCFFQGHGGLAERFVAAVVGEERGRLACDLYGGVGLFALPLARRYERVRLVEGDRVAARYARKNARIARLDNVEVDALAVESWMPREFPAGADRVIADPPRTGLAPVVRRLLVERAAARLTYVSCHAATLARDLRELAAAYDVTALDLVDLFPQTGHMEVVVQLARKS